MSPKKTMAELTDVLIGIRGAVSVDNGLTYGIIRKI